MNILLLCHKMPFPLHDGGACSIYHSALGLAMRGAEISVLAIDTPRNPVDASSVPPAFRDRIHFESVRVDTRVRPIRALLNILHRDSYFIERFRSAEYAGRLITLLGEKRFDVIQLEHIYMCLYLDTIRKHSEARVFLRPQNVENEVWDQLVNGNPRSPASAYLRLAIHRLRRFETEMAAKVDGIVAISRADAKTFSAYAPGVPVTEVPVGFDFTRIHALNPEKQFEGIPVFYHLGSMDWRPNLQGIRWFLRKVLPLVRKDAPDFTFTIAGKNMPARFRRSRVRGLHVDNEVKESLSYQEDKAVLVVPLLSGGGLRAKIIEGMALGKIVISTTIGASGIPYTGGKDLLIADTPEEFAFQIKRCRESEELRRTVSRNAMLLAREHYDVKVTGEKMENFYHSFL